MELKLTCSSIYLKTVKYPFSLTMKSNWKFTHQPVHSGLINRLSMWSDHAALWHDDIPGSEPHNQSLTVTTCLYHPGLKRQTWIIYSRRINCFITVFWKDCFRDFKTGTLIYWISHFLKDDTNKIFPSSEATVY